MANDYPSDWDSRRQRVYQRDDYQCKNCGKQGGAHGSAELHAHHIVPKSKGGAHKLSNLSTLCKDCHKQTDSYPVEKHTGAPHTWPGPEWNSDKGLSNGKEQSSSHIESSTNTSSTSNASHSESETETSQHDKSKPEQSVGVLKASLPSKHFGNYSANYSLEDSTTDESIGYSPDDLNGKGQFSDPNDVDDMSPADAALMGLFTVFLLLMITYFIL